MPINHTPRNPVLYNALRRRFGRVAIRNEGECHVPGRGPIIRGRPTSFAVVSGEYYCIACPYCRDTKFHLWVNHMFGILDDETKDDRLYLALNQANALVLEWVNCGRTKAQPLSVRQRRGFVRL